MDAASGTSPLSSVTGLAHVAIKAADLAATIAFYSKVLGMQQRPRPPFDFPGAWLGMADGEALVHLYAGERARDAGGAVPVGGAAIDHVSFWARGHEAQRARFAAFGLPYRSQPVPANALAQLFVYDPNGVLIELTYRLQDEPDAVVGARGGVLRFEPQRYAQFKGT
jgi:catechol 2,3-dioxygenase-like lactoylglutathione lyase family enzyme